MKMRSASAGLCVLAVLVTAECVLASARVEAAVLRPHTLQAWNTYVAAQERRMAMEMHPARGFLALDFQTAAAAAQERRRIMNGEICITQVAAENLEMERLRVPDGTIHHWRGSMFVPGVSLDFLLYRVQHPELETTRQEDVLESRVLERSPAHMKIYLKLQRSHLVTVVYNTEHRVEFSRHDSRSASSRSVATKIAEVERLQANREREKPEGHDRGFLWKMNSYWRYQQVPGGVIIECESITLSRGIPFLLGAMVRPVIKSIARESLQRTLESLRRRLDQAQATPAAQLSAGKPGGGRGSARAAIQLRSRATLAVAGSMIRKATRLPTDTDSRRVAILA